MKKFSIHHTISKGAFGVVRAGIDKISSEVVACKTIHCPRHQVPSVRLEIDIGRQIPKGIIGLVSILGSWCEHYHPLPCEQADPEDVHLLTPFAPFAFATAPWQQINLPTRLALFRQVLEGLRNLHAMGIMHRDISPRNLLVYSDRAPATAFAGITDYSKAKRGVRAHETGIGPPGFIPPEVGQIWRPVEYTNAINVFSLGLSMAAPLVKWPYAERITLDCHNRISAPLANISNGLGAFLSAMIVWDPSKRPIAEAATADPFWKQSALVEVDEDEDCAIVNVAARLQRSAG
ncbi:kinase-like domain-containing protein [Coniella lustricola]|uniref:EKC/KEOPS complex subunit BUD32 n=1 Tax=Coniella lustricola TaxID=2025994 RepID=A0A2T3A1C8_9PEZI|nr:kinase-like domain-containing protein [Coniella lustricola]